MIMENVNERSLEEIKQVLELAKLNEDDLVPVSQIVYFDENDITEHNYRFLELDKKLLNVVQEEGILYIKGDNDENVVICTKSKTYNVTETETSNSLLLTKNMKMFSDIENKLERLANKATISGILYTYLEATPAKPHLKKLWQLLEKSIYKGQEHEYEINNENLYTFDDLNNKVQASEDELREALNITNIITMNNKIRLLDIEYHFRVLSYMLKLIEENSWELDQISFEETLESLQELVPDEVITSLFEKYTVETKMIDYVQYYKYKEEEVCKFFAKVLLYGAGKFNLDDFLQAWQESVPDGMIPNEDSLNGFAIIDRKSSPNIIFYFPEEDLPEDIDERFRALFRVKEKWIVAEIAPYIEKVATDKLDINALLAKYARVSKLQGVKHYSAKHAK